MEKYYLNTEYNYGDFNEKKFALIKTEPEFEVVFIGKYSDLKEEIFEEIDNAIKENIGFLPDYEIN